MKVTDKAGNESKAKCSGSYKTPECCSETNPFGCDWTTACRDGETVIYDESDGLGSTEAGKVRHGVAGGTEDKLYLFKQNGEYVRKNGLTLVCAETGVFYNHSANETNAPTITYGGKSCKKVWIYTKCLSETDINNICSYSQCPG